MMTQDEAINILIAVAVCSTEYLYCDEHCPLYHPESDRVCNDWNDEIVKEAVETLAALRAQQSRGELLRRPGGVYMDKDGVYISPVQPNAPLTGWISVKDRMPEKEGKCIVHDLVLGVQVYYYHPDIICSGWGTVAHWMPLPEPPEEANT